MSVVEMSYGRALWRNFLGQSPDWYKLTLIIFLIVNPLVFYLHPFIAGWLLVIEFIFTGDGALNVIRCCRAACWLLKRYLSV